MLTEKVRQARRDRMNALRADPKIQAKRIEKAAKAARTNARRKASSERLKRLWSDPDFRAAQVARIKAQNADPAFQAARKKAARGPRGPYRDRLAWCPAERREDYKTLRRYYGAAKARAMIEGEGA